METSQMITMWIALVLGVQLCRFLPLVLPKSTLTHPTLQKLNKSLPLVIMVLLVLTSVNIPKAGEGYALLISQVVALVIVVGSYKWLGNILLSVALGVVSLNGVLWVVG